MRALQENHSLCLCPVCRETFANLRSFDAHRVGDHDAVFSAEQPNGRRCLSADERRAAGFTVSAGGHWRAPKGATATLSA